MATQGSGLSVETILPWISAVGALVIISNAIWPHLRRMVRWSISKWRSCRDRRKARQNAAAERLEKAARQQLVDDTTDTLARLYGMEQRPAGDFHYLEWRRQTLICKQLLLDAFREFQIKVRSNEWTIPPLNFYVDSGMWMIRWGPSRYDHRSVAVEVRWWDPEDVELDDSTLVLRKELVDDDLQRMGWTPYSGWEDGGTDYAL